MEKVQTSSPFTNINSVPLSDSGLKNNELKKFDGLTLKDECEICYGNKNLCHRQACNSTFSDSKQTLNDVCFRNNKNTYGFDKNNLIKSKFCTMSLLNFDFHSVNSDLIQREVDKKTAKRNSFNIQSHLTVNTSKSSLTKFDLILLDAYHDNIVYGGESDFAYNLNTFNNNHNLINKKKKLKTDKQESLHKCVTFLEPKKRDAIIEKEYYLTHHKNSIDSGYTNDADEISTSPLNDFQNFCNDNNNVEKTDINIKTIVTQPNTECSNIETEGNV